MKFITNSGTLLKQLSLIDGVVSTNTVLPILEDFLFDIKDGKLTAFATDLETSMSTTLDIESKENGKIAMPAKMLMNTLKSLPEQPLTFSINEKDFSVEITSQNGKFKMNGENGDDFPRIPVAEDIKEIKLSSSVLSNAINKTLFAVGTDEMRPAMTGVNCELTPAGILFVATDAHKLVKYVRTDAKSSKQTNFIIPKKALSLLHNAIPQEETQVKISYNNSNAFFSYNEINLICRLIDARFPDYNAVIPTENPNHLIVNSNDLNNSLKRVIIYANKATFQISMKLSGSSLVVSARDLDFSNEGTETLMANYSGEDMEIAFNGRFLIEMLSAMNEPEVEFAMSTPARAAIITPTTKKDNEELMMLVMPIMLNN